MSDYLRYVCWEDDRGVVFIDGDEEQVQQLLLCNSKKMRRMMGKTLVQAWNNEVRGRRLAAGMTP